ncbi:MAG: hypothetical protein WBG73_17125 [Coleofasciculaceae cyanobacterium]
MLTQLQIHYPKGSLVTELVAIEHGQFIVRCLVQNEDTILVTGMAAAHTVEVAEDQARSRAMLALGIDTTVIPKAQSSSSTIDTTVTPKAQSSSSTLVSTPIAETPVLPVTMPTASMAKELSQPEIFTTSETSKMFSVEANTPVAQKTDELSFSEPLPLDSSELETAPEGESDWMTQTVSSPQDTPLGSYQNEVEPETTSAVSSAAPIDFSDVIARTNVELKRLGWTNQQGRDYLVQTYGKRSRQLLTDDELLDFLKHLESEPSP